MIEVIGWVFVILMGVVFLIAVFVGGKIAEIHRELIEKRETPEKETKP